MRVTNGMLLNTILRNLSLSQERFLNLQSISSSGRRINRPSDDPIGITKDLGFRSTLTGIGQFRKNIDQSKSWLTYADQSLGNINELIISAKDLAVQMGNDTYDENARRTSASQANQIFEQILAAANSTFEGNFIFSGTKTNIKPFLANAVGIEYQGDYSKIYLETEPSSYLDINTVGANFLTNPVRTLGDGSDLNPGLQPDLWLDYLHQGAGVDLGAGIFRIRTLNGEYNVDVSAARNVQDVLTAINGLGIPNLTASISPAGNSLMMNDTTVHHMTATTPLGILNGGLGVDQAPGLINFTTGATTVSVDISAATNVGDVITAINTQLAAGGINNVTASIDIEKNALVITDSNVAPLNITISEGAPSGHTATDLGIIGEVVGSLSGQELNPYHIQVIEDAPGQKTAESLGLLEATNFEALDGKDLNPELAYFTKLSSLNSNAGYPLGKIRIVNGHDYQDVDLSPLSADPNATIMDLIKMINSSGVEVEARVNNQHTGIQVFSKVEGRSLMITEADTGRTAKDLGIFGSPDLLGNLMILHSSLERNNTEEINLAIETFDGAQNKVLIDLADVGARVNRADSASSRFLSFEYQVTSQLSNIEDADMTKVVTELASAQVVYQAALASAAQMLQPSLLQFLQ